MLFLFFRRWWQSGVFFEVSYRVDLVLLSTLPVLFISTQSTKSCDSPNLKFFWYENYNSTFVQTLIRWSSWSLNSKWCQLPCLSLKLSGRKSIRIGVCTPKLIVLSKGLWKFWMTHKNIPSLQKYRSQTKPIRRNEQTSTVIFTRREIIFSSSVEASYSEKKIRKGLISSPKERRRRCL